MGSLSATHWVLIALVFVLLFGAKRLPDAARGLGRSLRIFKSEMQEMHTDGAKGAPGATTATTGETPASTPTTPAELPPGGATAAPGSGITGNTVTGSATTEGSDAAQSNQDLHRA